MLFRSNKPVAIIPNCAATRHAHFVLDGSGPAALPAPKLEDWPEITWEVGDGVRRVNMNDITPEMVKDWQQVKPYYYQARC